MKKPAYYNAVSKSVLTLVLSCLVFLLNPAKANADAVGGSIEYEWVSDSTYRVFFKLFLECTGPAEPSTVNLCFYNSCTSQSFTKTLSKWIGTIPPFNSSNGKEVPELCANTVTKCQSPSATIQGYKEWWYSAIVTIPFKCSLWRISSVIAGRVTTGNLVGSHMYVSTTFNPTISWQNSSPTFSSNAVHYNCQNQQGFYNSDASDPDGDSISWRVINPLTSNNCSTNPTNVSFKTHTPSLSIPTNPFPTARTFTASNNTPFFGYTPTSSASQDIITIQIDEYRNGSIIGSVIRDVLMISVPCGTPTSPKPILDMASIQGADWASNKLVGCIGRQIQACIDVRSTNSSSKYVVSSNMNYAIPGVTVNYSNQGSNTVRGCFNWMPTLSDTGTRTIYFFIRDTACTHPLGLMFTKMVTLTIEIPAPVSAGRDTTICSGTAARLNATGGTKNYTWNILPGGTANSLSCMNCQNPNATPTTTSSYTVRSAPNVCINSPYYNDTVKVDIHTAAITTPGISINAAPATTVPKNTNITFTATDSNCNNTSYQWIKNGSPVNGAVNATWTTNTLSDQDIISCELTCNDTCPQPRITISNDITVTITSGISERNIDEVIEVYPNPNNGTFTIHLKAGNHTQHPVLVTVSNIYGQRVYVNNVTVDEQVNLSHIQPGIYIFEAKTNEHRYIKRIIVEK